MAVGDAHVFPGFITHGLTQISLQSHRLLFLHASAEMGAYNMPGKKFTSTGSRTYNQYKSFENSVRKGEIARDEQFLLFPHCFQSFQRTFYHFHSNSNCRLQTPSVSKSLKIVVCKRVNEIIASTVKTALNEPFLISPQYSFLIVSMNPPFFNHIRNYFIT